MTLDEILKEYRQVCFLVKDHGLDDKAVSLMASQNIITKRQIKDLVKGLTEQEVEAL